MLPIFCFQKNLNIYLYFNWFLCKRQAIESSEYQSIHRERFLKKDHREMGGNKGNEPSCGIPAAFVFILALIAGTTSFFVIVNL